MTLTAHEPAANEPAHETMPHAPASTTARTERTLELAARLRATHRRRARRRALVIAALALLTFGVFVADIAVGRSVDLSLDQVLRAAVGLGDPLSEFVVRETRMPRAVTALLAGALFGMSGALYQRLIGNPLATPDVIGVSAGASAGAVLAITTFGATGPSVTLSALVGALAVAALVTVLSQRGGQDTYRLILVGIGVGACAVAATNYMFSRLNEQSGARAMRFTVGSLNGSDWAGVTTLAVTFAVSLVLVALITRALGALALGDQTAVGLGVRAGGVRALGLALGAGMAAIVTSLTGPVAFVGLIAGPITSRLLRTSEPLVPAALTGAALVITADLAAQAAPLISPVPTGAVTAAIGAPVLIFLLLRRKATA